MSAAGTTWIGGKPGEYAKPQYIALIEATGTVRRARALMEDMIIWFDVRRPPQEILEKWERAWHEGEYVLPDVALRNMRQRLLANEEWANRHFIARSRKLGNKLAEIFEKKLEAGDEIGDDRVFWKYVQDGVSLNTATTSQAFGTPKPSPTQIGQLVINAGSPPPKRLRAPRQQQIIDVTAIDVTDKVIDGNS